VFSVGPPCGFIRRASCGLELVQSRVGVSELVERRQWVSSFWELTAEGKCQLKPAVWGWREMIASLPGHEPRRRGTSAIRSPCQATLMKTKESSLVRQFVSSETASGSAGRQS
jgi:hypothetical protein